jgi:hypothetical protein
MEEPAPNVPGANAELPQPTAPEPEIVASWHRDPGSGPAEDTDATAQSISPSGDDLAANLFRGIRTNGCACILAVPPEIHEDPGQLPDRPAAVTAPVPSGWPQWLKDALAGDDNVVPLEFERALPDPVPAFEELPVHRTDSGGRSFKLLVWPLQGAGLRMIAWVTGSTIAPAVPVVHGVSVVRNWPNIAAPNDVLNPTAGFSFPMLENPDADWPERTELLTRIEKQFKLKSERVSRLIWEPSPLSMIPALPLYEVLVNLPPDGADPGGIVRVLVVPETAICCVFLHAARASKAGG